MLRGTPIFLLLAAAGVGAMLFLKGNFAAGEKAFRDDLERNRRNGRSLFGLMECLRAQGKTYESRLVQQQFEAAWRHADKGQLRLEDY